MSSYFIFSPRRKSMITVKELRHMGQQRTNVTKDNLSNLSTTFSVANIFSVSLSCNSFYFFPDFLASFMAFQPFLRFFTKFLDPSSWSFHLVALFFCATQISPTVIVIQVNCNNFLFAKTHFPFTVAPKICLKIIIQTHALARAL